MPGVNDPSNPGEARAEQRRDERLSEDYSSEVLDSPEIDPHVDEDGEPIATEGSPPPEPTVRKGVAGSAAGGATLLLAWILSELGLDVPTEVQAAVAVLVGAGIAWYKSEY